jgi:hypothetical protein
MITLVMLTLVTYVHLSDDNSSDVHFSDVKVLWAVMFSLVM